MYELVSPVNLIVVIKYLAKIMIGMGVVLLAPLIAALFYGEFFVALIFLMTASFICGLGLVFNKFLPEEELQWKEALVIAALTFPFIALLSFFPLSVLSGMPFLDSFFEAVSGITTTGLSLAPEDVDPVFLFSRSWLQWIGGIGILVIAVMIFVNPGTSAYRLYAINTSEKKLRPTVIATARILFRVYLALTLITFVLLMVAGMSPFDALCHSLSSVSTGGFSTNPDSLGGYQGFILPVLVIVGCIMGALNFSMYPGFLSGAKSVFKDIQLKYFVISGIAGIILLYITLYGVSGPENIYLISFFEAFSALTTSGFTVVDVSSLGEGPKAILTVLMWIGGSVGSTAGGIKIIRLVILLKIIHIVFIRYFLPREALTPLKIGDDVVECDMVYNILTLVFLYFAVIIISAFIFMMHGFGLCDAVFEVSSALGTVGLSCGVTDAAMPDILKVVLIFDMLLGRIEIIPIFILFLPRTWIER
ncbi:TrkH family potassium uptake protein [Methanoplanus sp. FWC-SCC4]|uniref:TrkH family potassium uptake protein n=1 Tax=Methanochimaera problematica TaxID=2609417 RepID=A0AA97FBI3_9EURY|nr:TrkH family potassium uptake protein [Methanoplanus sp. FWC-SCC4]WOF16390.1 TrkH family potassium uptake protein [Methanoplanus sp. FWC-SCC4]